MPRCLHPDEFRAKKPKPLNSVIDASEASAPQVLEELVSRAQKAGASDIHLQMLDGSAQINFRLDGLMTPSDVLAQPIAETSFWPDQVSGEAQTYQESLPQDGRINKAELNCHADIRVATYPTVTGEKNCSSSL